MIEIKEGDWYRHTYAKTVFKADKYDVKAEYPNDPLIRVSEKLAYYLNKEFENVSTK